MGKIKFDYSKAMNFFTEEEVLSMQEFVDVAHNMVHGKYFLLFLVLFHQKKL